MPGALGVVDHGRDPAPVLVRDVSGPEKGGHFHSETPDDRAAWRAAWSAKLAEVLATPASSYADSARRLSALVRTGMLRFEDLVEAPAKFFEAHRLLARAGFDQGPGFSIRFTVQYNLFAGTVLELGGPSHLRQLKQMQRDGTLGCFALTERLAGVNSGLVVHTRCAWIPDPKRRDGGRFLLNTPHEGAKKNWISQGLVATKAVVVADLVVNDLRKGPHAFLVTLRDSRGRQTKGVTLTDMGAKTTGNDLDNASVEFKDVWLDRGALLDRHCDVFSASSPTSETQTRALKGVYVERAEPTYATTTHDADTRETTRKPTTNTNTNERRLTNMDRVGQRLFTGRVAVAQGAHEFRERLFRRTRSATDAKLCWVPGDTRSSGGSNDRRLSDVPQLKALYLEEDLKCARTRAFLEQVEAALCASLLKRKRPDARLVEAVAAAKVRAVDEAIEMTHRLRQEVGSYALMAGTGFEHTDFLQCCKFAEGDSRVLMMKMARDRAGRMAKLKKKTHPAAGEDAFAVFASTFRSRREAEAAAALAEALEDAASRGLSPAEAWDEVSESAYALAAIAIEEIVQKWLDPRAKL
jgi:acyl-CoA oxidase